VPAREVATLPGVLSDSTTRAVNTAIAGDKLAAALLRGTAAK